MNNFKTFGDVILAANDACMTVTAFYAETPAEEFEGVDWDNWEPSKNNN